MKLDSQNVDDQHVIFALIFMLSNQLQTIGDSFFEEVSTKQWFVMLVLGVMEGYSPTLGELSEAVGSSHQNVKQLVLKMEQKGYVEISKDAKDARRLRIKLTPKSEAFHKLYEEKSRIFLEKLFEGFQQEELAAAKKVMGMMRDKLEGMGKEYVRE
jgi:DNA-binding MarR family transcriptional regulator